MNYETSTQIPTPDVLSANNDNVWFLDVDGVLNAITRSTPQSRITGSGWASPFEVKNPAQFERTKFPIRWDPQIIERIAAVHTSGLAEVIWLTTWGHSANWTLRDLLGLPEFRVLADPESLNWQNRMHRDDWWKADPVRDYIAARQPKKVIWTDDDLGWNKPRLQDVLTREGVLTVSPHETKGLLPADLTRIEEFLSE